MTLPEPYYQDDSCTIYHADCREVLPHLQADVMVTDPPYGIAYASGQIGLSWWHGEMIACDEDTRVRDEVLAWWGERPALVFGTWKMPRPAATRMVLIWDKGPALGMGALDLPWKPSWEEIYVIGKGFHGYRGGGVLQFAPVQSMAYNGRCHPNEKPNKLLKELVGKCPGATILDPFMGSGSTLRATKDLGRKAIGVELEERYCEIAAKRLSQMVLPLQVA
jgi:hypothetical protein